MRALPEFFVSPCRFAATIISLLPCSRRAICLLLRKIFRRRQHALLLALPDSRYSWVPASTLRSLWCMRRAFIHACLIIIFMAPMRVTPYCFASFFTFDYYWCLFIFFFTRLFFHFVVLRWWLRCIFLLMIARAARVIIVAARHAMRFFDIILRLCFKRRMTAYKSLLTPSGALRYCADALFTYAAIIRRATLLMPLMPRWRCVTTIDYYFCRRHLLMPYHIDYAHCCEMPPLIMFYAMLSCCYHYFVFIIFFPMPPACFAHAFFFFFSRRFMPHAISFRLFLPAHWWRCWCQRFRFRYFSDFAHAIFWCWFFFSLSPPLFFTRWRCHILCLLMVFDAMFFAFRRCLSSLLCHIPPSTLRCSVFYGAIIYAITFHFITADILIFMMPLRHTYAYAIFHALCLLLDAIRHARCSWCPPALPLFHAEMRVLMLLCRVIYAILRFWCWYFLPYAICFHILFARMLDAVVAYFMRLIFMLFWGAARCHFSPLRYLLFAMLPVLCARYIYAICAAVSWRRAFYFCWYVAYALPCLLMPCCFTVWYDVYIFPDAVRHLLRLLIYVRHAAACHFKRLMSPPFYLLLILLFMLFSLLIRLHAYATVFRYRLSPLFIDICSFVCCLFYALSPGCLPRAWCLRRSFLLCCLWLWYAAYTMILAAVCYWCWCSPDMLMLSLIDTLLFDTMPATALVIMPRAMPCYYIDSAAIWCSAPRAAFIACYYAAQIRVVRLFADASALLICRHYYFSASLFSLCLFFMFVLLFRRYAIIFPHIYTLFRFIIISDTLARRLLLLPPCCYCLLCCFMPCYAAIMRTYRRYWCRAIVHTDMICAMLVDI